MPLALDSFSYHLHLGRHWFQPETPRDLHWYCEKGKDLGLDGLHIDAWHLDIDRDIDWLARFASAHGMYIELAGSGVSAEELAGSLDAAQRVGARILRTFVGGKCTDDRRLTAARARAAREHLVRSVAFAEQFGVCLALENHQDLFLEDLLLLLEIDSPFFGICLDTGNIAAMGEDPVAAVEILGERIVCMQLKDACPADRHADAVPFGLPESHVHFCSLGEGEVPLRPVVDALAATRGKDFPITLEIHTPFHRTMSPEQLLSREEENVIKSVRYARTVLGIP
jgi:3-oxoisoapionate decarboxylase